MHHTCTIGVKNNFISSEIILSCVGVCLYMGFGLMAGFIVLFDTARDYTVQFTVTH
jgi:hypothetical protein